jgi:hypothetical protein
VSAVAKGYQYAYGEQNPNHKAQSDELDMAFKNLNMMLEKNQKETEIPDTKPF